MTDNTQQNLEAQEAAKMALEKQKEDAYQKRLQAKREARARVSTVGLDNPFDIPEHLKDPRFHYMIVNDAPGRINLFKSKGYDLVTDKDLANYLNQRAGDPIKFATGMANPAWAYLMRIEKELFQEDQDKEREEAEEKFQALGIAPQDLKFAKDVSVDGVKFKPEDMI